MIKVKVNENLYSYQKTDRGNFWVGIKGAKDGIFPGANTIVPIAYWKDLKQQAIADGINESEFSHSVAVEQKKVSGKPKNKRVKATKAKAPKKNKSLIKIF